MNYIGSKFSLLAEIRAMLKRHHVTGGSFCDLFSGTATVAQMARLDGFRVMANDLQAYSHAMQAAFLETQGYPDFARLRAHVPAIDACLPGERPMFGLAPAPGPEAAPLMRVLSYLEGLPPVEGPFFQTYCEGGSAGRAYFARHVGGRCEAVRDQLEAWKPWLDEAEQAVLLASLIETMDLLANTASVYGAYLKQVKKSARAPFVLRVPRLSSAGRGHQAYMLDGAELVRRVDGDVLYLDPPYNHRQYHANYHVLETIARWDLAGFTPKGKTGLRPGADQRSRFCSRRDVAKAFAEVLDAARFKHILVSYNNEGLLPEADLRAMLTAKANGGVVDFHTLPYKRFRADADGEGRQYKGDEVREFLFYVAPRAGA
jgi:adenine-specific DNA-methyltransferase